VHVQSLKYNIVTPELQAAMNRANRNVRTTFTKLRTVEAHVSFLEKSLDLVDQWTPSSIDYQSVRMEANHQAYRHALDDLERLVVQRLLELTKLNIAGTGNINIFLVYIL